MERSGRKMDVTDSRSCVCERDCWEVWNKGGEWWEGKGSGSARFHVRNGRRDCGRAGTGGSEKEGTPRGGGEGKKQPIAGVCGENVGVISLWSGLLATCLIRTVN